MAARPRASVWRRVQQLTLNPAADIYDPGILTPLDPWAGDPNNHPSVERIRPWAPLENEQVNKNSKHPSVVVPPLYGANPRSILKPTTGEGIEADVRAATSPALGRRRPTGRARPSCAWMSRRSAGTSCCSASGLQLIWRCNQTGAGGITPAVGVVRVVAIMCLGRVGRGHAGLRSGTMMIVLMFFGGIALNCSQDLAPSPSRSPAAPG